MSSKQANAFYLRSSTLLAGLLRTGQLHAWSKISRRSLWNLAG